MRTDLDLNTLANFMLAISDYKHYFRGFTSLTRRIPNERGYEFIPEIKEFWKKNVCDENDQEAMYFAELEWQSPIVHLVIQTWGNTSAGWGGFGGSAMTSTYTTVIENLNHKLLFVYYGSILAYIVEHNDEAKKYKEKDFYNLPGIYDLDKSSLNVLYKTER